jgi:hypothetical protein
MNKFIICHRLAAVIALLAAATCPNVIGESNPNDSVSIDHGQQAVLGVNATIGDVVTHKHHTRVSSGKLVTSIVNSALGRGDVASFEHKVERHDSTKKPYEDHGSSVHEKSGHHSSGRPKPEAKTKLSAGLLASAGTGAVGAQVCPPPAPAPKGEAESEVPCECARDPAAPGRYIGGWPGAYAENGTTHERTLVYHGGGMALGNALLG